LIADDGIAKNVRSMVEKLDSLATKLEAGEGTLGKLLNDPAVYDQVRVVVDDLAAVTGALRRAEGSLGKLAMDDELYQEVLRAVGVVTRSLEEFREAAPITTFTSVLFGAF
jgi:phospholipid/cholesterol/gamma-HCH transport system substrate-binding protein